LIKSAPQVLNRLLASHPTKGDKTWKMKAHGWHKLQQTFVCATSDCVTTFWCALDARGALQIARFQHQHQTWSERNISVHLSVDKKPQAWVRVSRG
jgi:hypothetical protein